MDGGGSIVDIVGLTDEGNTYCCKDCQTHFALSDDVVSKETVDHESQKYKEGKFVLERNKILGPDRRNPSDTLAVQIGRLRIAAEEHE
ncbi:hypothetical protein FRX31_022116 [Thalictrum thalictroides]|uniref:Yippee domain-containing protein n=1 Tax=Thalictrum thalictroides TaxID=46969 RepID=A0A7J6VTT0_THATH|nr:hypothetical protein FRX31_022116 [Thalictrum thalictroides]